MNGWWKRLPLHWLIRLAARSQGFLDPLEILARLRGLAQPSEVSEPIELLRAGFVFHARGLINSKVIQNNLDWIWPYWVARQYNPRDVSFLPRAFSVTHVNLTQRNWTAVGIPGVDALPIVDPRGLLTPLLDGWSIDAWILRDQDGEALFPSRCADAVQQYETAPDVAVTTRCREGDLELESRARVVEQAEGVVACRLTVTARQRTAGPGQLVVSLRPCNPEGVAQLHTVRLDDGRTWTVNDGDQVYLDTRPDAHSTSDYHSGDVRFALAQGRHGDAANCNAGLASAAAVYDLHRERRVELTIPIASTADRPDRPGSDLASVTAGACQLKCPDDRYRFLFDAALASLVLHAPRDVYPGPYTYRRFWFRDAAFILQSMLCMGLEAPARRCMEEFFSRQTRRGYFRSQEGEWDSNGEVLWLIERYRQLSGSPLPREWHDGIRRGAQWIERKRQRDHPASPHAGLMPAGFSAEHLGPNDYYYWDDFWSLAGLESAARLLADCDADAARRARDSAARLRDAINRSLDDCRVRLGRDAMPAAPYRRLDAGAVGSLAAGYPLNLMAARDPRLLDCAEYLLDACCIDNAFFQDMVHSGFNAYLTLHLAQVLLRAGDARYLALVDQVATLASPTGQWPEAIHPRSGGGCMGDGQHIWAAAEWVLMLRHFFLRECDDELQLCPGIPQRWLDARDTIAFGPAATAFGSVSVSLSPAERGRWALRCTGDWHDGAPTLRCVLPGYRTTADGDGGALLLEPIPGSEAIA